MEEGYVEYDKRLNWIGAGVFLTLSAGWYVWLAVMGRLTDGEMLDHLMIAGVSAAIGLFVHASWQLLLYPYAVYKIRRMQGDTPAQALKYFGLFLLKTLLVGIIGAVLGAILMGLLGTWLMLVFSILCAWAWDRSRRQIRTVDVLSKSRDLTLK